MIWRSNLERRTRPARRPLPGGAADLAFSIGTYLLLSTVLGVLTVALRWELEPYLGSLLAETWGPLLALAYCVWQFRTMRRLRRAQHDLDTMQKQ